MPAPKGHKPYEGCEKGGKYGYLGKPEDAWTKQELIEIGKGLLEYLSREDTLWYSGYLAKQGINQNCWDELKSRYKEILSPYVKLASALQEEKLFTLPFFKKANENHARLVLRVAHKKYVEDLNAHAKAEKSTITEEALLAGLRSFASENSKDNNTIPNTQESIRSSMEDQQSILHQECPRESNPVQNELGSATDIQYPPLM